MLKITVLGLVLAMTVLSGTMSVADAEKISSQVPDTIKTITATPSPPSVEKIPPPLQQVRDGVPLDKVVCSYGRILMVSTSGAPACVFAGSVEVLERRGFVPSSGMPGDDLLAERPETSEKAGGTGSPGAFKTGDRPFITTWKTTSPNESITIPVGNTTGAYTVRWGDGSTSANVTGDQSHAYEDAGTYIVAITGNFERIYLNGDLDNAANLKSIEQWGDISWTSMGSAFNGASNMIYSAADVPDLSGVTDMSCMFADAIRFDGDISSWNVSNVRDMSCMFATLHPFNYVTPNDDSRNDVLYGSDTVGTFSDRPLIYVPLPRTWSTIFNGDLSGWDVSGVRDMSYMFYYAKSFNGDLSGWDVLGVRDMSYMFYYATSFNGNISGWDVSGVRDMSRMFYYATSFNGDISGWDVSGVRDMDGMFGAARAFEGDLSEWDVSGVRDMSYMFYSDKSFNGDLSGWDVSGVTDMGGMFYQAYSFNGDLSDWDVSGVRDMSKMFVLTDSFNGDLSGWDVSGVRDMGGMFNGAKSFNGDISGWDVSGVTDMPYMFAWAGSFNGDLSDWDVSGVTDMHRMLYHTDAFNQNLGNWYVVLDNASGGSGAKKIGNITAQNPILDSQDPTYGIGSGAYSALFEIDGDALLIKPSADYYGKTGYTVNITSTGDFGVNNFRVINVTVTGTGDAGSD